MSDFEHSIRGGALPRFEDLEQLFPSWQSIELFGASGAGKTHLCHELAGHGGVWATSGNAEVQGLISRDTAQATRAALQYSGRGVRRKYMRWRERRTIRSTIDSAGPKVERFIRLVEQVLQWATFENHVRRNFEKVIYRSTALLILAEREGRRVLVDEGILRRTMAIVVMKAHGGIGTEGLGLIRDCLAAYPWNKNAILLEAGLDVRYSRVRSREAVGFDRLVPHMEDEKAGELIASIASECDWRMAVFRSDPFPGEPAAQLGRQ